MVSPVYIIVALLGIAFTLGLLGKPLKNVAGIIALLSLGFTAFISLS